LKTTKVWFRPTAVAATEALAVGLGFQGWSHNGIDFVLSSPSE